MGQSSSLLHGSNDFTLENGGGSPRQALALDSIDVMYWGELDIRGGVGAFELTHWKDQVASAGETIVVPLHIPPSGCGS